MSYNAPPPGYQPPMSTPPVKPNNYLVWSILATLFCCLPFGIAAIVSSAKVDSLYMAGRYVEANAAAASAKKWILWAVGVGVAMAVLYGIVVVIGLAASSGSNY
jgi:hypothetical protein